MEYFTVISVQHTKQYGHIVITRHGFIMSVLPAEKMNYSISEQNYTIKRQLWKHYVQSGLIRFLLLVTGTIFTIIALLSKYKLYYITGI